MINHQAVSFFFVLCILCSSALSVSAQDDRPTEDDIKTERAYVDANRDLLLGNTEEAIAALKEIAKENKSHVGAHYLLGRHYAKRKKFSEAIGYAERAYRNESSNETIARQYADLLSELGQFSDEANVYASLIESNSKNPQTYYRLAYAQVKADDYQAALETYQRLEDWQGITEDNSKRQHSLYLTFGQKDKAAQALKKLADQYPSVLKHRFLLADFYVSTDQTSLAKSTFKDILKRDPENAKAKLALQNLDGKSGGGDQIAYLQTLQTLFQDKDVDIDTKVKELIPVIDRMVDRNDDEALKKQVIKLGRTLVKTHPEEAKAHSVYGDILINAGDGKQAVQAYKRTLELDESVYPVWEQYLYLQNKLGRFESLAESAEEAIDLFPNQPFVYYMHGIGLENTGKFDEAASTLGEAKIMALRDKELLVRILYQQGSSYYKAGKYDKSNKALDEALEINAEDIAVLNLYSFLLAEDKRDIKKAKTLIAQAEKLAPDNPFILDTYGWILFKDGDYKSAVKWAEKAINKGGAKNPEILENLGDIYFKLNKTDQAVEQWQKAKTAGSKNPDIDKKISSKTLIE